MEVAPQVTSGKKYKEGTYMPLPRWRGGGRKNSALNNAHFWGRLKEKGGSLRSELPRGWNPNCQRTHRTIVPEKVMRKTGNYRGGKLKKTEPTKIGPAR